jgi:hypothetical protein
MANGKKGKVIDPNEGKRLIKNYKDKKINKSESTFIDFALIDELRANHPEAEALKVRFILNDDGSLGVIVTTVDTKRNEQPATLMKMGGDLPVCPPDCL